MTREEGDNRDAAEGNEPIRRTRDDVSLHIDDLIDDRALTREEDDEFGLRDIADEVARLCAFAPVPATVALYGSWGSGKSSLANLLQAKFALDSEIAFARFDAFKYAEIPLRRHFISQLASKFKIRDPKFSEGLYTTSRDFRLRIPPGKWWGLLKAILVALLFVGGMVTVAALIFAFIAKGPFRPNFVSALRFGVPGAALAAPVLAAALGLLGNYFTAETTVDAPSTEEQFERVFRSLVTLIKRKRRCERIVVFIDELDRCSPGQVVTTLETLRTFLEVKPCIFIVAADQQVLEHALTQAARQATPFNPANPYYSAGSAYLDKIFQYQLALPPVLPRRLSRYALGLIENRQGVWRQIDNRANLVSILVPTHVSSPRRVKALLNSFALLYRLALKRSADGTIEPDVQARSGEVAKLACLRTEFPLFAADLRLDDRLPELVLRLHAAPNEPEDDLERAFLGLSPEVLVRAGAYAREELPVDEVIARTPVSRTSSADVADEEGSTAGEEAAQADTIVADETEAVASLDVVQQVERSHARQLIRFLQRTQTIVGPRRDLIYLESSGAAFGLPPELADQLERAAVDGAIDQVEASFARMTEGDQQNAFRLLARLLYEAIGIEAQNVARSVFRAIAKYDGTLTPMASELVEALNRYTDGYELAGDELIGGLSLALAQDSEAAMRMRAEVLRRDEALEDEELAALILARTQDFRGEKDRIAEVFAAALSTDRADMAASALNDVPDASVIELVRSGAMHEETVTGLASFVTIEDESGRVSVARAAFQRLVSIDSEEAGLAAVSLIPLFVPVSDADLAVELLNCARRRPVEEAATWLGAIDASAIPGSPNVAEVLDGCLRRLWQQRFQPGSGVAFEEAEFRSAATEIGRLRASVKEAESEPLDLLEDEAPILAPPGIEGREEQYEALTQLVSVGAAHQSAASASVLTDLSGTLRSPLPGQAGSSAPLSDYVVDNATLALSGADEEDVVSFLDAGQESSWLEDIALQILKVRCALAQRRLLGSDGHPPDDETLEALVVAETERADAALGDWITGFEPEPLVVFEKLATRTQDSSRLTTQLTSALRMASAGWTPQEKADVLEAMGPAFTRGELDATVIEAASLAEADAQRATEFLIEAFKGVSNNEERRAIMKLWQDVNPSPEAQRRKLIDRIYIPLLKSGKGAAEIALAHFPLVRDAPTQAARERVKKAITAAATGEKALAKRAERLMQDAGWIPKKARWLKRVLGL